MTRRQCSEIPIIGGRRNVMCIQSRSALPEPGWWVIRWGQVCISVVDRIFHKHQLHQIVVLFKRYLPIMMDLYVYFPSITGREAETPNCKCGSVCVPYRAAGFLCASEALSASERTLSSIISSWRTDPFVVTNVPLALATLLPRSPSTVMWWHSHLSWCLRDVFLHPLISNLPASLYLEYTSSEQYVIV